MQFFIVDELELHRSHLDQILKWYQARDKNVVPVHPKETEIEGLTPVKSLNELADPSQTSVSVITPPKVRPSLRSEVSETEPRTSDHHLSPRTGQVTPRPGYLDTTRSGG